MKICKCLFVFSVLFLQSSFCFAEKSINVSLVIDPSLICSQPIIDFAVTARSILGIAPGSCRSDRSSNTSGRNVEVRNNFNRIAFDWRYAPRGVFKDGFYVMTILGIENDKFSSSAGSTADVTFLASALSTGYQWFWKNGFNITGILSASHLTRISLDNYKIAPTERSDVIDFLDSDTSTNTHYSYGVLFGWAF